MGNKEQMMHVARKCFNYERGGTMSSCAGKTCANCTQYAEGTCLKDLFECTLLTFD